MICMTHKNAPRVDLAHAHGSTTHYLYVVKGCRCVSCRASRSDYQRPYTNKFRAENPGYMKKYRDTWKKRYPEKRRAQKRVANAIRNGRLKRLPCEVCGGLAEAHHDNYDKPLAVRWLCLVHHRELHKESR